MLDPEFLYFSLSKRHRYFFLQFNSAASYKENDCDNAVSPLYVWAPGAEDLVLPDNVGIALGNAGFNTFKLEVHYDNPNGIAGMVDNSGVRLLYTPTFRQYNVGIFMVGDPMVTLVGQSVGEGWRQWDFSCPGTCAEQ